MGKILKPFNKKISKKEAADNEEQMKLAEEKAGKELDAFINELSGRLNVFVVPRVQLVADVFGGVKVAGGILQVVHKKRVNR